MKLDDLAGMLVADGGVSADAEVAGVSSDSRQVAPGALFVAVAGTKADGAAYAADAARRGAVAIVAARGAALGDAADAGPLGRRSAPGAGARRGALHPRQPATMVAVTGTSGKTSVAAFTRQIWEQAGNAAASIGTTGVVAPGRNEYGSLTTPDPVALHRLLTELADAGVTHAAMEASSHGLDQRRLDGVQLAAGGFTNLGRDHMDYHPTVEDYHRAKMRLFDTLLPKGAPAVIFADDPWSKPTIAAATAAGLEVLTVGRHGDFLTLKRVEHERYRQRAEIEADGVLHEIDLPLAGDFQISNALVAAGLAIATGTPAAKALAALEHLKGAPGRLDLVGTTREWRAGLCRLCPQARCAGERADLGPALHHRPRHRGVRLRRRPRPRQAADHGRDRDAACRCRHRHRRQSALGSAGRHPRRDPGCGARRHRDRRPPRGDPRGGRHAAGRRHADRRRQGP